MKGGFRPIDTDDAVRSIWNQLIVPLQLQRENSRKLASDETVRKANDAVGVLRVTNICLGPSSDAIPRSVTWEDVYLLEFIAEIIFVLTKTFVTLDRYENEIERLLHGFQFLISGAHQNLSMIEKALTAGIPDKGISPLKVQDLPGNFFSLARAQDDISDAKSFLEDMEFQFEKSTKRGLRRIEKEWIDHFQRDVLMVAVKNARRAAVIYDKERVKINFIDRDVINPSSLDLPRVFGNKNAFISVLRNLFENSIKYSGQGNVPRIDIKFDDSDSEYLFVAIRDFGVGIKDEERPFVFNEGFRGSAAHDLGAIGIGFGLSYSKEIMRQYGGNLMLGDPKTSGVEFLMKIRRRP